MNEPVPFSRLIAYLRKSRDDGEDSVEEVLARHERILQDFCRRTYDAPLPADRLLREVQSGETIESRPVMQDLMRRVRNREVDGVLVVELQRLSRGDFIDIGELERLFQVTGCKIVTPTRTLTLSDDYDRQYFEMELLHGREYLSYIKKILRRGVEQSSREGNYVSSVAPYGYKRTVVNRRPTLEPDPDEAPIIRMIFEWYARERVGPTVISDRLNALGLHTRGGGDWNPGKMRHIIENPVYIGKIRWNYRRGQKEYRDGEVVTVRHRHDGDDVILVDGKHPPLIDEALFREAQDVSHARAIPASNRPKEMRNPFAGLLRCGNCNYAMTAAAAYHYKSRDLIDYSFNCTYSRGCGMRGAYLRDIMAVLRSTLAASLHDLDVTPEEKHITSSSPDVRKLYADELSDIGKQRERMYSFLERGIYTEEIFLSRRDALNQRESEISAALARLEAEDANVERAETLRANLSSCLALIDDPETPAQELNAALKKFVDRIVYTRAPRQHGRNEWTPIQLTVFYK